MWCISLWFLVPLFPSQVLWWANSPLSKLGGCLRGQGVHLGSDTWDTFLTLLQIYCMSLHKASRPDLKRK